MYINYVYVDTMYTYILLKEIYLFICSFIHLKRFKTMSPFSDTPTWPIRF